MYKNLRKYVKNRWLRTFYLFWVYICVSIIVFFFIHSELYSKELLTGICCIAAIVALFVDIWASFNSIKNCSLSKRLVKKYKLDKKSRDAVLSDIDKEMSNPVYLDKYLFGVFFAITPNWILGSAGLLLRYFAIKIDDVKKVEKQLFRYYRKSSNVNYHMLRVFDSEEDYVDFVFRSEEKRDKAYELVMNIISERKS